MLTEDSRHILIVDDDKRIGDLLAKFLNDKGYFISRAQDAESAYLLLNKFVFDLIILDIMLPTDTGLDIAKKIRENSDVPIIMLTALGDIEDRITGLESGADDYLSKPFEPKELVLRIERILSRVKQKPLENIINFGKMSFDLKKNILSSSTDGVISLTSGEAKLLTIFVENEGKEITREELALIGGINEKSVDVQIIRLRSKIEEDQKKPIYLQTVRGKGYIFRR